MSIKFSKIREIKYLQIFGISHLHKFTFRDVIYSILKNHLISLKENVTGLPDPDKEQSTEMKPVLLPLLHDAVWHAQTVVSKKARRLRIVRLLHSTGKSAKLKCSEFLRAKKRCFTIVSVHRSQLLATVLLQLAQCRLSSWFTSSHRIVLVYA